MPVRKSRKANGKANGHALGRANGIAVYPFRVGRSRTGLGIFATAPIKKGKFIVEYTGPLLSNKQCETVENKYLFEVNARWTIDGSSRKNVARYINHSCRGNADVYFNDYIKPHGCKCDKCLAKRAKERAEVRAANARKKKRLAQKLASSSAGRSQ